jgi:hypothetical protein
MPASHDVEQLQQATRHRASVDRQETVLLQIYHGGNIQSDPSSRAFLLLVQERQGLATGRFLTAHLIVPSHMTQMLSSPQKEEVDPGVVAQGTDLRVASPFFPPCTWKLPKLN